jgi:hypothetical protein
MALGNPLVQDGCYKSKLKTNPTDVRLFQVLEEALEELNDYNAYLEATDELYGALEQIEEEGEEPEDGTLPEYGHLQIATMVKNHFLHGEMTQDSKLLQWGKVNDTLGFIHVMTMWLHDDLKIPQAMILKKIKNNSGSRFKVGS